MEALIDKCTGSKSIEDNWATILEISDRYAIAQPKHCLKLISKKIFQPNPHISLKAITLLDGCVKNAGNKFVREMSSRDFVNLYKSKYSRMHATPRNKLLQLTKQWSEEFRSNSELSLLTSLYSWVYSEYPQHVRELEHSLLSANKEKHHSKSKTIQAKEDDDFAKAIALSLIDTGGRGGTGCADPAASSSNFVNGPQAAAANKSPYPVVPAQCNATQAELGKVRALFDFEAAEDNELTFKTGDIITLLDTTDVNWWKGRTSKAEGLFPSQFVTKLEEGEDTKEKRTAKNEEETQSQATIDPFILTACLEMINEADPTGLSHPDPPELPQLEMKCRAMEPLIDRELQEVDKRISNVDELNAKLMDALAQFHDLVSRAPPSAYGYQKQVPMQPPQPLPGMGPQYAPAGYQINSGMYPKPMASGAYQQPSYANPPAAPTPPPAPPQLVYQPQPTQTLGGLAPQPPTTSLPGNQSPALQQPIMYQPQQQPIAGPYVGAVPSMPYGMQPGGTYAVPGMGYPVGVSQPLPMMYGAVGPYMPPPGRAPVYMPPPGHSQNNSDDQQQQWHPLPPQAQEAANGS